MPPLVPGTKALEGSGVYGFQLSFASPTILLLSLGRSPPNRGRKAARSGGDAEAAIHAALLGIMRLLPIALRVGSIRFVVCAALHKLCAQQSLVRSSSWATYANSPHGPPNRSPRHHARGTTLRPSLTS